MARGMYVIKLLAAVGIILTAAVLTTSSQTCDIDARDAKSKGVDLEVQTVHHNKSGNNYYTKTISCSLNPRLAGMKKVTGLKLRVFDPCSKVRTFYRLASVWSNNKKPQVTMEIEDSLPLVSGKIEQSQVSQLSLSWNLTNLDAAARAYQCVAMGKNRAGRRVSLSQSKIDRASSGVGGGNGGGDGGDSGDDDQIDLVMEAVTNLQKKVVAAIDNQTRHLEDETDSQTTYIDRKLETQTTHIDGKINDQNTHIDGEIEKLAEYTDGLMEKQTAHIGTEIETQKTHIDGMINEQTEHIDGRIGDQTAHIDERINSLETYVRQSVGRILDASNNCLSFENVSKEIESRHQAFVDWLNIVGSNFESFDFSTVYNDRIYLVSKVRAKFNIDTADKICENAGGYLVELDDDGEYFFVRNFVMRIGGSSTFYTGTNDIGTEGRFVHKRSGKPLTINKWNSGQPDNGSGTEDCVEINTNMNGNLNDYQCWNDGKYVCEIPFPSM